MFEIIFNIFFFNCETIKHMTNYNLAWMTNSWEGKSRWTGFVLGKIKTLWSSSQGTTNGGLNQLVDSINKIPGRKLIEVERENVDFAALCVLAYQ